MTDIDKALNLAEKEARNATSFEDLYHGFLQLISAIRSVDMKVDLK